MMKKRILFLAISSVFLGACSSAENRKQASGDFVYLEAGNGEQVQVPENLDKPDLNPRYAIPGLENTTQNPLVGKELSIASPRLVIPLVAGSHIEEGQQKAKVLFDQINDNEPLTKTIWDTVLSYLELNQIGVESFDRENNTLVTEWVVDREEIDSSWYDVTSDYIEKAKKFKLTLDVAPHGRTVALTNELVEFVDADGNSVVSTMNAQEKRENEVNFLNFIIAEYDFGIRLEQTQRIALIRDGFPSELGFNNDGEPAIVVDAIYGNAWPRIQLVLRKMNFDVVDLDQSSGLLFVKYTGPEEGWFSGLFSDDKMILDEGDYRLQISRIGEKTSVTFKDAENQAFTAVQVAEIFPVFSELMASDDLDL